jgi:hypothetical protein
LLIGEARDLGSATRSEFRGVTLMWGHLRTERRVAAVVAEVVEAQDRRRALPP